MVPPEENLIRGFDNASKNESFPIGIFAGIIVIALVLGVGIGYVASHFQKGTGGSSQVSNAPVKQTIGIADKKTFKDNAEGILKEGGIGDEGSFHLERPGGASQNVYLTSSTVDLSQYVGKKVRVWGQTNSAQKAGWLMDVGLVEVL